MEDKLREELLAVARANGKANGKMAELDFGAGAQWMYDKLTSKTCENCSVIILDKNKLPSQCKKEDCFIPKIGIGDIYAQDVNIAEGNRDAI